MTWSITGPASLITSLCTGESGLRRERHADQPAHRSADPVHGLDVEARDQRHHVGDVLRHWRRASGRRASRTRRARRHPGRHPVAVAHRGGELVEVARAARQAMDADEHPLAAGIAPLQVRKAMQPARRRRSAANTRGRGVKPASSRRSTSRPACRLRSPRRPCAPPCPIPPPRAVRGTRAGGDESRKRDALHQAEPVLQPLVAVVLGIRIGVDIAHQQLADALAEVLEAPDAAGHANHRRSASALRPIRPRT